MKIAIPVKEKSLDSFPDDRFARGRYFLIYDPDSEEQEFIDLSIEAAHGAGPVAVNFLTAKGGYHNRLPSGSKCPSGDRGSRNRLF
jgi:predicted Fe-Mo cluster-binding NifX family protein